MAKIRHFNTYNAPEIEPRARLIRNNDLRKSIIY